MAKHKIFRCAILIVSVLILIGVFCFFYRQGQSVCMGVKILSKKDYEAMQQGEPEDVGAFIYQDSMPVAMDAASSTIYISQDIDELTYLAELNGILNIANGTHSLAFAPDAAFSNLAAAVREGHAFQLLVTKDGLCCKQYNVVFTNLPVIRLSGTGDICNDEGANGTVTVWSPRDSDTGKHSVKDSLAQWHIRGGTSSDLPKKPLKLNLKDDSGNNRNVALLGMGEDDDWILNAMGPDDLKIREVVIGSIWKKIQETSPNPQKMSCGEYAEVIYNNTYQGLYLLQRRIDQKYLELDTNNVLLKGGTNYSPPSADVAFETKYNPQNEELRLALSTAYYESYDPEHIQLDNWLDVSLLCQIGCLPDNCGYKNMYYLWDLREEKYSIFLIPWDTDMAFGYGWDDARGVVYKPEERTSDSIVNRQEYAAMQNVYPELEAFFNERWAQLRKNGLSAESAWSFVELYKDQIVSSGAYGRDVAKWGVRNNNVDTFEALQKYIEDRFAALDIYYQYSPHSK